MKKYAARGETEVTVAGGEAGPPGRRVNGRIGTLFGRMRGLSILLGFLVVAAVLSVATEYFFTLYNLIQIFRLSSFVGIMALGSVFVLSQGDVDISIASIYSVVGVIAAVLVQGGVPVWFSVLTGFLFGVLCGFTNIFLSLLFNMPVLIITLGTSSIFRGLGLIISKGSSIYQFPKDSFFFQFFGGDIGHVPFSIFAYLLITFILFLVYRHTRFGIHVRAVGGSRPVARAMGIKIRRTRILVLMLNGALASVAALLNFAYIRSAAPNIGRGLEFMVIASAIIGGTSLTGGSGSVWGALIGALLIEVIRNGMVLMGIDVYWSPVVTGLVIIAAVAVDYLSRKRRYA
jgi:ribose transport system permease protein